MNEVEGNRFLEYVLEIGRQMVECGAEVRRVEDTITRISMAYGYTVLCSYSLTTIIKVTLKKDDIYLTQGVRAHTGATDLGKLEDLNELARNICKELPDLDELQNLIEDCKDTAHKWYIEFIGYLLAAFSFAIFFGGYIFDGIASSFIAILIYLMDHFLHLRNENKMIYTAFASFIAGCVAIGLGKLFPLLAVDKIIIGDVMLLIPTLHIVNGIKEMFYRDVLTGVYRMVEAIIIAAMIAAGFGAAMMLFRG